MTTPFTDAEIQWFCDEFDLDFDAVKAALSNDADVIILLLKKMKLRITTLQSANQ